MKTTLPIQFKREKCIIPEEYKMQETENESFSNSFVQISRWFLLFFLAFLFSHFVSAQKVETLKEYLQNANPTEVNLIENLLNEETSTLFLFNGDSDISGDSTPKVVSANTNSIDMLYSENSDFNNIELIRIILKKPEELSQPIDLDKLSHFKSLKYIQFVVTYNICSDENDIECQKSEISKLASSSEETSNPTILFQVVTLD